MNALIIQYSEEIEEILTESEHVYRLTIDYDLLDQKVEDILKRCKVDGIKEEVIWDLIQRRIPSYINYLNFKNSSKRAA